MATGKIQSCSVRAEAGLDFRDPGIGPSGKPQGTYHRAGRKRRQGDEQVFRARGSAIARRVAIGAEDQEPLAGIEGRVDVIRRAGAERQRLHGHISGIAIGFGEEQTEPTGPDVGPHECEVVIGGDGGCPYRGPRIDRVRKPPQGAHGVACQLDTPQSAADLVPPIVMSRQAFFLARTGAVGCEYQVSTVGRCGSFEVVPVSGKPGDDRPRPGICAQIGLQDRPPALLLSAEEEPSAAVHECGCDIGGRSGNDARGKDARLRHRGRGDGGSVERQCGREQRHVACHVSTLLPCSEKSQDDPLDAPHLRRLLFLPYRRERLAQVTIAVRLATLKLGRLSLRSNV